MDFIDTHCHLYLHEFEADIPEIMQRADNEGVRRFYLPSIDSKSEQKLLQLADKYPDKCFPMAGLHPCSVKENAAEELKRVEDLLATRPFAAIGEIGLDFYWDKTFMAVQYDAFEQQIDLALAHDLPIVIHSRQAMKETIDVLRSKQNGKLRGIFHCFGEDLSAARAIIDLGFHLGIGGILTYKNSFLPAVLREIDLSHIVLETDAPYLPPVPFRGKRNESSYIKYTAAKLAEIKCVSVETVAEITTSNALKIFGN